MRAARLAGVLAMAAFALAGCTRHYVMEDLRASYQEAELPAVFAGQGGMLRFSGYAAYAPQEEIRYGRDGVYYTEDWETDVSTSHPVHSEFRVKRDFATFGGTALYMGPGPFVGLSAGLAAPHPGHWHMGFLGGWTRPIGRFTPMISAGAFYSKVNMRAVHITQTDWVLGVPYITRDTTTLEIQDLSWPLKLGLMMRAGPVSPYLVAGRDATSFWPIGINGDESRYTVRSGELTLGVRIPAPGGLAVSWEAGIENVGVEDYWDRGHLTGRMRIELDRF